MFNRSKEDRDEAEAQTAHGLHEADDTDETEVVGGHERQRQVFGGTNWGAGFFGWLVAVGMAILLSGIVGAIAAAVGNANDVTQTDLERRSGTIGITAAVVLLVVLLISYYAGGYVAGRMSRFDGGRQGFAVWLIGVAVVIVAAAVGGVFGSEYDVINRVDVPDVPIPTDDLTTGGAITIAAALVVTLLAALAGGRAGTHYHRKVDRAW
jgi:heme/copper-type cytochrome/quinol oxidase subunit 1